MIHTVYNFIESITFLRTRMFHMKIYLCEKITVFFNLVFQSSCLLFEQFSKQLTFIFNLNICKVEVKWVTFNCSRGNAAFNEEKKTPTTYL